MPKHKAVLGGGEVPETPVEQPVVEPEVTSVEQPQYVGQVISGIAITAVKPYVAENGITYTEFKLADGTTQVLNAKEIEMYVK